MRSGDPRVRAAAATIGESTNRFGRSSRKPPVPFDQLRRRWRRRGRSRRRSGRTPVFSRNSTRCPCAASVDMISWCPCQMKSQSIDEMQRMSAQRRACGRAHERSPRLPATRGSTHASAIGGRAAVVLEASRARAFAIERRRKGGRGQDSPTARPSAPFDVAGRNEDAVHVGLYDDIGRARQSRRDDGQAACHRFDERDRQPFTRRRQDEDVGGAKVVLDLGGRLDEHETRSPNPAARPPRGGLPPDVRPLRSTSSSRRRRTRASRPGRVTLKREPRVEEARAAACPARDRPTNSTIGRSTGRPSRRRSAARCSPVGGEKRWRSTPFGT